jgi:hypothetical protein
VVFSRTKAEEARAITFKPRIINRCGGCIRPSFQKGEIKES